MARLGAVTRTLVRLSAAITLASALSSGPAGAQPTGDRCPPPAFERMERNPSANASFLWRSDVEHRHADNCLYEQIIENRVFNNHESLPLHFTWGKAGLFVPRSAPLLPGRELSNFHTIPPQKNATVAYNEPLYYGSKSDVYVNTNVYVIDEAKTTPDREASFFELFSRIVGNGQTADGKVDEVVLEASSFTDVKRSDGTVSFTTRGPVGSLALSGLRNPSISNLEHDIYYSRLRELLGPQNLALQVTSLKELGFEAHDNSHYESIERADFIWLTPRSGRVERITIPLPRATEQATFVKLFAVILDAKGNPGGTGFVSVVFPPVPKR